MNTEFEEDIDINVRGLNKGLYLIEVKETKGNNRVVKKVSVM